jgi:coproporphyrinogen III oxidase-like Fe-S oxidoreductase
LIETVKQIGRAGHDGTTILGFDDAVPGRFGHPADAKQPFVTETQRVALREAADRGAPFAALRHLTQLHWVPATTRLSRDRFLLSDDAAEALIGFGASGIGSLPQGYVANETTLHDCKERIRGGQLAAAPGRRGR